MWVAPLLPPACLPACLPHRVASSYARCCHCHCHCGCCCLPNPLSPAWGILLQRLFNMCLKRAGGAAAAAASASSICSCATCHSCHSCWHRITRTTDKRIGYQLQLQQLQLPLQLQPLPAALFRFALFRFSINFALTAASPNATGSDAATAAEAAYLFPPPNAVTRKLCNVIFNMTSAANPPQSHLPI